MTLDEYFTAARLLEGEPRKRLIDKCFGEHGGLSMYFQQAYGKELEPYEGMSYAWEALPYAINEWDESKGKASTCWKTVTRRLIQRRRQAELYKGGVKVDWKTRHKYEGCDFADIKYSEISVDYLTDKETGTMIFGDDE